MNDFDQGLRDLSIEVFPDTIFEVSKIGFTGEMGIREAGIEAVRSAQFFIPDDPEESFHIGELFQVSEEFQKEEADWVVGMAADWGVGGSGDGSDEGEIDQGGDEASQPSCDLARGVDLNPSGHKGVMGQKPA